MRTEFYLKFNETFLREKLREIVKVFEDSDQDSKVSQIKYACKGDEKDFLMCILVPYDSYNSTCYVKYQDVFYVVHDCGTKIAFGQCIENVVCEGDEYIDLNDIEQICNDYGQIRNELSDTLTCFAKKSSWLTVYKETTEQKAVITIRNYIDASKWWRRHNRKIHGWKSKSYFKFESIQTRDGVELYCVCQECEKELLKARKNPFKDATRYENGKKLLDTY